MFVCIQMKQGSSKDKVGRHFDLLGQTVSWPTSQLRDSKWEAHCVTLVFICVYIYICVHKNCNNMCDEHSQSTPSKGKCGRK